MSHKASSFFCYLLATENDSNTYVGATVDLDRRLRQHNHELVGGAHATGIQIARGHTWNRVCYIEGIPDWRSALQIEWRWKQLGRTRFKNIRHPVQRRLYGLRELLAMDRPTTAAIPYRDYVGGPPNICWEDDTWKAWYYSIKTPTTQIEPSLYLLSDASVKD